MDVPTSQANNNYWQKFTNQLLKTKRSTLGKTVQVIPHITDEIKHRIQLLGKNGDFDIVITEIGGTIGDIESLPYVEAVRQMMWEFENDCIVVHLTLIPYLSATGGIKTKTNPTFRKTGLLEFGVQPNILCCQQNMNLT